jgi:hypothetical protein
MGAQIGALVFATSGVQLAVGFGHERLAFAADQFVDRAADLFRDAPVLPDVSAGGGLSSVARARLSGVMFSMSATIGVCRRLATHQT